MKIGLIGSGSWGTALAKILTDNDIPIHWWFRSKASIKQFLQRGHNPRYLSSVHFKKELLLFNDQVEAVIQQSDTLILALPSSFVDELLSGLPKSIFKNKKIVSSIKGIIPSTNQLLNDYLMTHFDVSPNNYFTLLGPCHAEEIASEKLSYLTVSGKDCAMAKIIAHQFQTVYVNTTINADVTGVQYAAVLKNVYALGAGIAHGLEYGDNFLSVYISNCAAELTRFLQTIAATEPLPSAEPITYSDSVYLGDLLVTCYSLYSRNRTFGNMLGKGYSVKSAKLEMNMVAEGYNASRCIYLINEQVKAHMPIATTVYKILWKRMRAKNGFKEIEKYLL